MAADGNLFTTFLATLNTAPCFAGHCHWRIPTVKELLSIMDYSKGRPATSVPGVTSGSAHWSSTSLAGSPFVAWSVEFNLGASISPWSNNKHEFGYPGRVVRGGR